MASADAGVSAPLGGGEDLPAGSGTHVRLAGRRSGFTIGARAS